MTTRLWHVVLMALLALVLAWCVVWTIGKFHETRGAAHEQEAHIAEGEANAHQAQAQKVDPQVENLKAIVASQAQQLARVSGERDVLLKKWNARPIPSATPTLPAADDRAALLEQLDLAQAVIEKDQEEIEARKVESAQKDALIAALTTSRDEWKATAEARDRQARAQEAATAAWKSACKSERMKGRIEGSGAVGVVWAGIKLLGGL